MPSPSTEPSLSAELVYDPYDEAIDVAPYEVWRRLRDEAPLYYNEQYDFYAVSRFADVLAASLDWPTYSSARGTVLELIDPTPPVDGAEAGDGFGMMIFMDPPGHDELRRLVSRAFTPRRVAALETRTRDLCAQFLDPQRGGTGFDFVEDFAAKIPAMLIGALLGVPERGPGPAPHLGRLVHAVRAARPQCREGRRDREHDLVHGRDGRGPPCAPARRHGLGPAGRGAARARTARTRRLTVAEVMAFFSLLQLAGSETTARLLGWAAVLLARHPDQRAKLVADARARAERGRGAAALRSAVTDPGALRDARGRVARPEGAAVLEDRDAHRQRGPRRARVPRRRSVRRRAAASTAT